MNRLSSCWPIAWEATAPAEPGPAEPGGADSQTLFAFMRSGELALARSGSLAEGEARKRAGQLEALEHRGRALERARALLVALAQECIARGLVPEVTSDDAHDALIADGWAAGALGNAAGSLFRGGEWLETDRRIKSTRRSRHAGKVSIWLYVGGPSDETE